MESLLEKLNPKQKEAVLTTGGAVLILAGPGSGKTATLTTRIAYLISRGVSAENILAVTFTNRAAEEMRERIQKMAGSQKIAGLFIGTFHSFAAGILRVHAPRLGYLRNFTIFDDDDTLSLIKEIMKELEINPKQFSAGAISSTISRLKSELITSKGYADASDLGDPFPKVIHGVYAAYEKRLHEANSMDFDDLLMNVCLLFEKHPEILASYQDQFRYIHVDEWQDTNTSQYALITQLAQKHRNIAVVGDDAQCLPPNTRILTPSGSKRIDALKPGEEVIAAAGNGQAINAKITRVKKFLRKGTLVKIRTKRGKTLLLTPNHILFGRLPLIQNIYYVYLMYRYDKGFRIGTAKGARHPRGGELENGLRVRNSQEKADRIWILKVAETRHEAIYWEFHFSFSYGIPMVVFDTGGRTMKLQQGQINQLYATIDTRGRAKKLMQNLHLSFEFPHWRPQGTVRGGVRRLRMRVAMFDNKHRSLLHPWCLSRVALNTRDEKLRSQIEALGYRTRKGKRGTWRIELTSLDYGRIAEIAENFQNNVGPELETVKSACLVSGKRLHFQPASHMRKYMITAVYQDGAVLEDEIQNVALVPHEGHVYDLDIDMVHNYIANGIVIHNSIYGWRNADYRNIFNFEKDFPEVKTVILDQNYRSTQVILDAAKGIIEKNRMQKKKNLWTERKGGEPIIIVPVEDERAEAEFVVNSIKDLLRQRRKLKDIVILYRTNAQSRTLEEVFLENNFPYKIIGGIRFYQRKEVKDILAYLRLLLNPSDILSLKRIINVPARGVGKQTLLKYLALYRTKIGREPTSGGILEFEKTIVDLKEKLARLHTSPLLKYLVEKIKYREYLEDSSTHAEERWENVKELISLAKKYDDLKPRGGLEKLLEDVTLMSEPDEVEVKDNAVSLMTLHAAKGLEFPIVFMVGMEDGIFPHSRSLFNLQELEEERRLCYVGLTRAKEKIFLTFALQRKYFGSTQVNPPSRFISEIPEHLFEIINDPNHQLL